MDSSDRQFEEQRLELVLAEVRKQIAGAAAIETKKARSNAEAVRAAGGRNPPASRGSRTTVAMADRN